MTVPRVPPRAPACPDRAPKPGARVPHRAPRTIPKTGDIHRTVPPRALACPTVPPACPGARRAPVPPCLHISTGHGAHPDPHPQPDRAPTQEDPK